MADKSNSAFVACENEWSAHSPGESAARCRARSRDDRAKATDGDRDALFAHRQLAELRLEESPWRAALHLRKLILADAADDGVLALMGLCQAMLGNFQRGDRRVSARDRAGAAQPLVPPQPRASARRRARQRARRRCAICASRTSSKRAKTRSPRRSRTAWRASVSWSRRASWRRDAARSAPRNASTARCSSRIERGAPGTSSGSARATETKARVQVPASSERSRAAALEDARSGGAHARDGMPDAGFSPEHVHRAQALWADFPRPPRAARRQAGGLRGRDRIRDCDGARRARRDAGGAGAPLRRRSRDDSSRYAEIRSALALVPGDPRYCLASQLSHRPRSRVIWRVAIEPRTPIGWSRWPRRCPLRGRCSRSNARGSSGVLHVTTESARVGSQSPTAWLVRRAGAAPSVRSVMRCAPTGRSMPALTRAPC